MDTRSSPVRAWHFLNDENKLRDGRVAPADGQWLVFDGQPSICNSGLHASRDAFDALRYAPGNTLCLVECRGIVDEHTDKLVCTERLIVARMDASPLLRFFARQQALSVLHLYPGNPEQCVLDWLAGDDSKRSAAYSAARSATDSATGSAARSAARSATDSATGSSAFSAAYSAARSAAFSAAFSATDSSTRAEFNALVAEAFTDWLA